MRIYLKALLEIFIIFSLNYIFVLWLLSINPHLYRLEDFLVGLMWVAVLSRLTQSHWSYYILWFINLYLDLINIMFALILIPIIPNLVHNHYCYILWFINLYLCLIDMIPASFINNKMICIIINVKYIINNL